MKKAVIFDIDGTLADTSNRQYILQENPSKWGDFFAKMGDDVKNDAVCELYTIIKKSGEYKMIIVSGRPDNYQKLTEQWLAWNEIEYDELYMRNSNDNRPDSDIKRDILHKLQEVYTISFVVDDRTSVVNMWREEGIICFQCDNGDF